MAEIGQDIHSVLLIQFADASAFNFSSAQIQ
jgi:hypothetical protein